MIPISNIYYMLSYAFTVLQKRDYQSLSVEDFDNIEEMYAAILVKGISSQVKRGLNKGYQSYTEDTSSPRGKLEISDSLKDGSILKRRLTCTHDEFTVDIYMNRVIKATVSRLLGCDISKQRKHALRSLMLYFEDVAPIDIHSIDWHFRFDRNNQTYRMLISICYLFIQGFLQSESEGVTKLASFIDEQSMCRLYEKFILEYYKKEFPELHASASQIPWNIDDDDDFGFLPVMRSDITLTLDNRVLIIDAKYYSHLLQSRYDSSSFHSSNLYQIYTYVKNKQEVVGDEFNVAGMLLYAQTDEGYSLSEQHSIGGNSFKILSLDLNQSFTDISSQLNNIVYEAFLMEG